MDKIIGAASPSQLYGGLPDLGHSLRSDGRQAMGGLKQRVKRLVPLSVLRTLRRFTLLPLRRIFRPRIPIAMITGTKGKTTTTRMTAHILATAGHRVGFCTTDGVVIDGSFKARYDASGYFGARDVLTDPNITAAVLETARGDIVRSGFYLDRCDAAALLNVGREQIGIDGVDTVEEMAALKGRVLKCSRGPVVLGADNDQTRKMIGLYPPARTVVFSLEAESPVVRDHIAKGGTAYVLNGTPEAGTVERWHKDAKVEITAAADLPSCGKGLFPQNIANAMAAAALAEGLGVPLETVRAGLQSFGNSPEHSPGRLTFIEGYAPTVLLDSARQAPSAMTLVESVDRIAVPGRKICMFDTVGNRPDWHYTEFAGVLGPHFDHFVCYDVEKYQRGRAEGEIAGLLKAGLVAVGVAPDRVDTAQGYVEATQRLAEIAGPDDLVVIVMSDTHKYMPIFHEHFARHRVEGGE